MMIPSRTTQTMLVGAAALAVLTIFAYLPTLQRIPNGSEHLTMIDVGETQTVLNVWGTLHATGYPLYVMLSSALVAVLKLVGIDAATAPSVTSLLWGLLALGLMYALMTRISSQPVTAAAIVVIFGVTRFVWLHQVIAEVYSFTLLCLVTLLLIALWNSSTTDETTGGTRTIYLLALVGGLSIAHHRALAMVIPAAMYAVYPLLRAQGRRLPRVIVISLILGLIGLLPYAYLMARAGADAAWVYGEPSTLQGLYDQFMGREASRFIGSVSSLQGLVDNFVLVTSVLFEDMTWIGVALGVVGLGLGILRSERRRAAVTLLLSGAAAYLFHVFVYTDILAALILAVELSLAFGWLFLAEKVFEPFDYGNLPVLPTEFSLIGLAALAAFGLITLHRDFISGLTSDPSAQASIRLLENAPPDSTLMIAWGPRHFAVGFARDVLGVRPDVTLIDHKRDVRAAVAENQLVTPDFTFYTFPIEWWETQYGGRVYLTAFAPHLIRVQPAPVVASSVETGDVPYAINAQVNGGCYSPEWALSVDWVAPRVPTRDYSVFVHVLDAGGDRTGQADQSAPVYGWYPFTRWSEGEQVHDVYPLENIAGGTASIRFGLYYQHESGEFINVSEQSIPVRCGS